MTYERAARVLLMRLSVRTSAKGTSYLSGYLGKAQVVAFKGGPDAHGNETWDVFVSEPRQEARQDTSPPAPASEAARQREGAQRAPQPRQGTHAARLARVGGAG